MDILAYHTVILVFKPFFFLHYFKTFKGATWQLAMTVFPEKKTVKIEEHFQSKTVLLFHTFYTDFTTRSCMSNDVTHIISLIPLLWQTYRNARGSYKI